MKQIGFLEATVHNGRHGKILGRVSKVHTVGSDTIFVECINSTGSETKHFSNVKNIEFSLGETISRLEFYAYIYNDKKIAYDKVSVRIVFSE